MIYDWRALKLQFEHVMQLYLFKHGVPNWDMIGICDLAPLKTLFNNARRLYSYASTSGTPLFLFITNEFLRDSGMEIKHQRLKVVCNVQTSHLRLLSQRRIPAWEMTRRVPALSNNHRGRFVATRDEAVVWSMDSLLFFPSGLVYVFHSTSPIPWLLNLLPA